MILLYLFFSTYLYFVCEWLKTTSYIPKNLYHMYNCLRVFKPYLRTEKLYAVCDQLNYQSDFNIFLKNLVFTNLCVYALIREWSVPMPSVYFCVYWCIAFGTAIVYSLLGNYSLFQFSISSTSHLTLSQFIMIASLSCFFLCLCAWQCYRERLRYRLLCIPLVMYGSMYALLRGVTAGIGVHFHHALTMGTLSLCFTDFKVRMNRWVHAFCIGIFIQGINFYTIEEIFLFNTEYIPTPTFLYTTWLCILFPLIITGVAHRKTLVRWSRWRKTSRKRKNSESLEFPLLPTKIDIDTDVLSS
jgi:hypothetical protein